MNAIQLVTEFTNEQMKLIKTTIAKDATDQELALFINQCKRTGLDPFTKQIYFIKDKNGKVTVCASIDGLRLIAERSDKYEGQTEPQWCGEDGVWRDVWLSKEPPAAARVGVYKSGFKSPVYGVAIFKEYAGYKYGGVELTHMWAKMPAHMISKTAEAMAFRKAFPNDLSGIYAEEELSKEIEAHEVRQATTVTPAKEVLADAKKKDDFVFTGGQHKGKKFDEISAEDFSKELEKYEQVANKSKALVDLMDNMNVYLSLKNTKEQQG